MRIQSVAEQYGFHDQQRRMEAAGAHHERMAAIAAHTGVSIPTGMNDPRRRHAAAEGQQPAQQQPAQQQHAPGSYINPATGQPAGPSQGLHFLPGNPAPAPVGQVRQLLNEFAQGLPHPAPHPAAPVEKAASRQYQADAYGPGTNWDHGGGQHEGPLDPDYERWRHEQLEDGGNVNDAGGPYDPTYEGNAVFTDTPPYGKHHAYQHFAMPGDLTGPGFDPQPGDVNLGGGGDGMGLDPSGGMAMGAPGVGSGMPGGEAPSGLANAFLSNPAAEGNSSSSTTAAYHAACRQAGYMISAGEWDDLQHERRERERRHPQHEEPAGRDWSDQWFDEHGGGTEHAAAVLFNPALNLY